MSANKERYVQFPIHLLGEIYQNHKEALEKILFFGVWKRTQDYGCTMEEAHEFLKLEVNNAFNKHVVYNDIEKKAKQIEVGEKEPMPMVKVSLLLKYIHGNPNAQDLLELGAYIAIRSILGEKIYFKVNYLLILARMLGYKDATSMPMEIPEEFKCFDSRQSTKGKVRHHFEKLIEQLELNWRIAKLGKGTRGFYVAFGVSYDDLALIITKINDKKKNALTDLRNKKKEAWAKAKNKMKSVQETGIAPEEDLRRKHWIAGYTDNLSLAQIQSLENDYGREMIEPVLENIFNSVGEPPKNIYDYIKQEIDGPPL